MNRSHENRRDIAVPLRQEERRALHVGAPRDTSDFLANPLAIANCPELSAVTAETFGDTVKLLIETDGQYNRCRTAALALPTP